VYGALATDVVDETSLTNAVERFAERNIVLPTFAQLADPSTIPETARALLGEIDHNAADARNLWRVHWYNRLADQTRFAAVPEHVVIGPELSGVPSPIILAFGDRFPMITAHKVLAAYSCLVARLVTGQFDPTRNVAIWPSTGNYARGGVAISRIMDCRGSAVLPENMSRERFEWLERWTTDPSDIVRTPGSESNVKEIYDACHELAKDPANVILNQFSEFANHVGHYEVTGRALGHVFETYRAANPDAHLAAFVSASGSAGTLGAGDRLKHDYNARIVAVEALECPTMLYNGFGEHNIQGIGDKHIPLIHNVMNTDLAIAISDRATDELYLALDTDTGRRLFAERGVADDVIATFPHFGFSSLCNLLAAIKTSKTLGLGADDVIVTVATDGADLYESEREKLIPSRFDGHLDDAHVTRAIEEHLDGADTSDVEVLDDVGRRRVFNLGYYTWVEQQGVSLEDFEARRDQSFWKQLHGLTPTWDAMIDDFNARTGATIG
jgi:cysteine synthase